MPEVDASELFGRAAATLTYDDLSAGEVDCAKRGILDTLGVSLAATGAGAEYVEPVRGLLAGEAVPDGVPALGYGWRLTPGDAALWMGALSHAVDFDDYADNVHPSAPVVTAALPLAQSLGTVDGRSFIAAVAAGQDLVVRLSLAVRQLISAHGWLQAMPNVFGSALASAKVLGLDAGHIQDALGLALHRVSGTMLAIEGVGSGYRAVRDGFYARDGLLIGQLAAAGLGGDDGAFEARYGLFPQFFADDFDREVLLGGLGSEWYGSKITFKPWPCAGHTHLFLTAIEQLIAERPIDVTTIDRITLVGGSDLLEKQCEPKAQRSAPARSIDAKVSLPFLVAKYLRNGTVALPDFVGDGLHDAAAIALAQLVGWRHDPAFGRTGEGFGPGVVEIAFTDGTTRRAQAEFGLGNPANPLSWDQIVATFHDCVEVAAMPIPRAAAEEVVDAVENLESVKDVGVLVDKLTVLDLAR
jgi:2-methylcitrate dehydratase PrpD